MTTAFTCRYGV